MRSLLSLAIKHRKQLTPPLVVLVAVVLLTAPHSAHAADATTVIQMFLALFQFILKVFSLLMDMVIKVCLYVLVPLLTNGTFITHPFVTAGWPFIQGIANIGFILVLLYLAFATTLGLDTASLNVYKVLPRLLFAAVLINFSLVLTGILLDLTRILMAIMIRLMSGADDSLSAQVLDSSAILPLVYNVTGDIEKNLWVASLGGIAPTIGTLLALVFKLIFAVALVSLIGGLFIRYVALLLLLIASPLAFLASVLPNTQGLSKKWWSSFLKYAFYGPIALFILLLITQIGQLLKTNLDPKASGIQAFIASLVSLIATCVMLFMATKAGSYMGVQGANTVTNWAEKRARGFGKAAIGASTMPYRAVGNFARTQARDISGVARGAARDAFKNNKLTSWAVPAKRDDKGKLKPGEESYAQKFGQRVIGYQGKKGDQFRAAKSLGPITAANVGRDQISPTMLSKGQVTDGLGKEEILNVVEHGSAAQIKALLKNNDYLRSLKDHERVELQKKIAAKSTTGTGPGTIDAREQSRILERLIDRFDSLDNA